MDNNNQHGDFIEDDLNPLSSSNELDTTIENTFPEENASNFSSIKKSFEQQFIAKQPPMFTWGELEQNLDALSDSDAPSKFSSLKNSFEEVYKDSTTPNFTWEDLENKIDNPENSEDKAYDTIKEGFEQQYNAKILPLFSWDELEQRIEEDYVLSDTAENYSVIKKSFEDQHQHKTPTSIVWTKIQEQLFLDTFVGRVWVGLKNLKNQQFDVAQIALVVLVMFVFCEKLGVPYNSYLNGEHLVWADETTTNQISKSTDDNNLKEDNAENKGALNPTTSLLLTTTVSEKKSPQKLTTSNKKESLNTLEKGINEREGAFVLENKKTDTDIFFETELNSAKSENASTIDIFATNEVTISTNNNSTTTVAVKEKNALVEPQQTVVEVTNLTQNTLGVTEKDANSIATLQHTITEGSNTKEVNSKIEHISWLFLEPINITTISETEVAAFKKEVTETRLTQSTRQIRFEVGAVGKVGTTLFLGNTNSESVRSNSFSRTKNQLTGSFGLSVLGYLTTKDAVVIAAYPYSVASQYFGAFTRDGYYTEKEIKLSYLDFTLGYQRIFAQYSGLGACPSTVYARLNLGLGYLNNEKTTINGVVLDDRGTFSKWNLSLGLSLGHTHQINQLIIDYGISGNMGMNNLVTETNTSPIQATNLMNLGGYLGVRYVLFSKMNLPNKKRAQEAFLIGG